MGYSVNHLGTAYTPDAPAQVESQYETDARNRATSAAEVEAFKARTADRWFAYWGSGHSQNLTTWIGDPIARVTWVGREYKCSAFGRPSVRVNFRAFGIDGRKWAGTYYKSSGSYVRMRVVKPRR